MWSWFVDAMRDHPELAIFLTLALGFFIGRLSFKSITLGAVTGTLLAGVPASISLFVAWRLMRLPAPLALGSIAGQQCSTPAITAVQQAAGNTTPLMSYTIVYALSNVVLPLLGPIVVAMSGALA